MRKYECFDFSANFDRAERSWLMVNRCPKCWRHGSPVECGFAITPKKGGDGFKCSGYRCAVLKGER